MDIGCGGGEFAEHFLKGVIALRPDLGIHLVEADPSLSMLNLARKRFQDLPPQIKVSLKHIGVFPPSTKRLYHRLRGLRFDLIIASFILAWIDDWNDAIDQFLECLFNQGFLCIVELSYEHKRGRKYAEFRRRIYEIAHQNGRPQRLFVENLETLLRERGIKYESEITCSKAVFKEDWAEGIGETLEFFLHFPRRELTEVQIREIKKCTIEAFGGGPLESCKKILWVRKNE